MLQSMYDLFPRSIVCVGARRIKAHADSVWALVGDLGGTKLAESFIEKVELVGKGTGAVRHLHVRAGFIVSERVEEYNEAERHYVYRVIDGGPLSFTHHLAVAKVVPAGPDQCIASWITTVLPLDGHEEEVRKLLQGNIDIVLDTVRDQFERR